MAQRGQDSAPSRTPGGNQPQSIFSVVLGASPNQSAFRQVGVPDSTSEKPSAAAAAPGSKRKIGATQETPVPVPQLPGMSPAAARPVASAGRGRPRGWRPGMSYAEARGNPQPRAAAATARQNLGSMKRRGRPPRNPSPGPRGIYQRLQPPFTAFLCEWKACKAELHNLETLRRHVDVVHIQRQSPSSSGGVECRWGKCGGGQRPVPEFEDDEDLKDHVEEAHLVPFGWHVGDGPTNKRGTVTGDDVPDIPDYLKDADGNQVTPSIKDQELEDIITWRNNRRKLKELLIQRDMNLPSDESDEPESDVDMA